MMKFLITLLIGLSCLFLASADSKIFANEKEWRSDLLGRVGNLEKVLKTKATEFEKNKNDPEIAAKIDSINFDLSDLEEIKEEGGILAKQEENLKQVCWSSRDWINLKLVDCGFGDNHVEGCCFPA